MLQSGAAESFNRLLRCRMRILVDEARFLRLAETATVVPVVGEMVADDLTPVMAYARLTTTSEQAAVAQVAEQGGTNGAFLLESVVGGERWARYSFVGFEPTMLVTCAGDRTVIEQRRADGGFEKAEELPGDMAALRALMGRFEVPSADALADLALPRFWGGAVGYFSYDIVSRFEPTVPTTAGAEAEQRLFSFGIGATVVIFDSLRQTIKVVVPQLVDSADEDARRAAYADARARLERAVQRLRDRSVSLPALSLPERALPKDEAAKDKGAAKETMALPPSSFEKDAFCEAVERCHEHIRAGDIFQVVLAQRFEWEAEVDPLSLYRALRVVNPSPYMFHVRLPDVAVAGASPETLVRVEDGVATLRPIAGTRPRGATREEDLAHEASLLADPKERAEHVMLVDLGRNDLGRIAQTGSVQVTDAMVIERYSHVMHMTSNIEAKLRDDVDVFDVIAATFPAGTLSGAPKVRAMQIIADLEPAARRLYGGAVGYLGFDGAADLAIAIRTVEMRDGKVALQAGAGIVEASDPETEWHETLHKARAGLVALAMAEKASS